MLITQSSNTQNLVFLMIDSSDHLTGKTGLSPTVTLSKNGGSFNAPAGAVSEIAQGWYKVAGHASDVDTLGPLALHATAAGADPVDMLHEVVAFDVQDADGLGLSRIDADITSRAAPGDEMDLVDAPNEMAITAIQAGLATGSDVAGIPAEVWSESTRTLTAFSFLTAGGIADAVWDEALAGHDGAGSAGAQLSTASAGGDPLASAVPGSYEAGTAGDALARVYDIRSIVQAGAGNE